MTTVELPTGLSRQEKKDWLNALIHDTISYGQGTKDDRNHTRIQSIRYLLDWLSQNPDEEPMPGRERAIRWLNMVRDGERFLPKHRERAHRILNCYANNDFTNIASTNHAALAGASTAHTAPGLHARGVLPGTELASLLQGIDIDFRDGKKRWIVAEGTDVKASNFHGNNGIPVGQWYPRITLARLYGAHGFGEAGIYGREKDGAFSIIVSALYNGADQDSGDTIWYSSPSALTRQSNASTPDKYAGYLRKSLHTQCPVRVIRGKGSRMGPICGYRYDGLYTVDSVREKRNGYGIPYDQFHLTRNPNQPDLDEIRRARPTKKECGLFAEMDRL